jgi:hypothetical protein
MRFHSEFGFDDEGILKCVEVEIEPLNFSWVRCFVLVVCIWSSKSILEDSPSLLNDPGFKARRGLMQKRRCISALLPC